MKTTLSKVIETFFSVTGELLGKAIMWKPKVVYGQQPIEQPTVFESLARAAGTDAEDNIAFFADPRIFRFRINPNTADIKESKLHSTIKTAGGWEVSWGGENLIHIGFTADTGYLGWPDFATHDDRGKTLIGRLLDSNLAINPAYHNFQMFYDFYKKAHEGSGTIALLFWNSYYEGYLTDLSYKLDANDPNHITYTFNFLAQPDKTKTLWSMLPPEVRNMMNAAMMQFNIGEDIYRGLYKSPVVRNPRFSI